MFFSHDRKFLVKTISDSELKFIQSILPEIYTHLQANPKSLLARIYGIYNVNLPKYNQVNLILMGNTLRFRDQDDLMRIYDLKGSRVARLVGSKNIKPSTTLKDMDFFRN